MNSQKNKIESLQALRALAFLGIFLIHARISWGWPRLGVSIFYAMSGFLMTYTYFDRELPNKLGDTISFSIKKIKKLYPLHILTMVAVVFLQLYINHRNGDVFAGGIQLIRNIILNVFLLQSWYPDSTVNVALNGVAWYLSVALFLYFIFPWILRFIKNKSEAFLWIITLIIIGLQIVLASVMAAKFGGDSNVYTWFMYCFPVFRMGDFFAGCVLGKCYLKKGSDNAKLGTIAYTIIEVTLLAITIALSIWLMKPATSSIIIGLKNWTSLYIPMALAWIWIFTNCRGLLSKALSNPALIALGNISPQAFLIHYVVVRIANAYMSLHGIAFTPAITGALFAGEFIVTVILSQWYKNGPARPVPGPWL